MTYISILGRFHTDKKSRYMLSLTYLIFFLASLALPISLAISSLLMFVALILILIGVLPDLPLINILIISLILFSYQTSTWPNPTPVFYAGFFALLVSRYRYISLLLKDSRRFRFIGFIWLVMATVGVAQVVINYRQYSILAIRDANFIVDSLALFLFASFAYDEKANLNLQRLFKLLPILSVFVFLGYFVSQSSANSNLLLFQNVTPSVMVLIAYFLYRTSLASFAGLVIAFAAIWFVQARIYILLIPIVFLLIIKVKKHWTKLLLVASTILVLLFSNFQVNDLNGRIGPVSSLELRERISDLANWSSPNSGSVNSRFNWWASNLQEINQEPKQVLFGKGTGMSLIANDSKIRRVHNEYFEFFLRFGLTTILFFISIIALIFKTIRSFQSRTPLGSVLAMTWVVTGFVLAGVQPYFAYAHGTVLCFGFLGYLYAFQKAPQNLQHNNAS